MTIITEKRLPQIYHIFPDDTFIDEFIEKIDLMKLPIRNFYIVDTCHVRPKLVNNKTITPLNLSHEKIRLELNNRLQHADFIFLHSLTKNVLDLLQSLETPGKILWIIWGYDLYRRLPATTISFFSLRHGLPGNFITKLARAIKFRLVNQRKSKELAAVIHKIDKALHFFQGDVNELNSIYNASLPMQLFFYPNVVNWEMLNRTLQSGRERSAKVSVMVGNSASLTNNHFETVSWLNKWHKDIKVFYPLSYGDDVYRARFSNYLAQHALFDYELLTQYLPPEKYASFLNSIDVCIMNHSRPEGVGNISALIYLGKKVFLNEKCETYSLFKKLGCHVFGVSQLSLHNLQTPLSDAMMQHNRQMIYAFANDKRFEENMRAALVDLKFTENTNLSPASKKH